MSESAAGGVPDALSLYIRERWQQRRVRLSEEKLHGIEARPKVRGFREKLHRARARRERERLETSRRKLAELELRHRERRLRQQEARAERARATSAALQASRGLLQSIGRWLMIIFAGFGAIMFLYLIIAARSPAPKPSKRHARTTIHQTMGTTLATSLGSAEPSLLL